MKPKTAQPRARKMWANYYSNAVIVYKDRKTAMYLRGSFPVETIPVAVIPLVDTDDMVLRAAIEWCKFRMENCPMDRMYAALTAIGVLPKSRAKKGRK